MKKDNEYIDSMMLCGGHSIIVGHIPEGINPVGLSEKLFENKTKESLDNFGFFGDGLNYNTYYPDTEVKDFNPSDDEFIEPMFRLLSSTIVNKSIAPTEFPQDVLKKSMNLLVGQTVNCDHETSVGNAIGTVKSVVWQESYTDKGIKIPAGINGVLKIDAKANPRLARGINMNPPSIHSNSVTVRFRWKPSHKFENETEFFQKWGTYDEKGELIRRVVTDIISYQETSLVSHGADPFAQIIKDGKINNPIHANAISSLSDQSLEFKDKINKQSYTEYKGFDEIDILYNTSDSFNRDTNLNPINNNMNELEKFLDQLFGENMLEIDEGTKPSSEMVLSQIKDLVESRSNLSAEIETLRADKTTLETEISNLKSQLDTNKLMASVGESRLKEVRQEALDAYKKLTGEKVDNAILTLLENPTISLDTLVSLRNSYQTSLEEKFPLHCNHCGSNEVSRSSATVVVEDENQEEQVKPNSVAEHIHKLANGKNSKVKE